MGKNKEGGGNMEEITEEKPEGTELAETHWKWLEGTLHLIYVDAMVHGVKHGREIKEAEMKRREKEINRECHKLNVTHVCVSDIEKPCQKLGYCPYGALVEEYPLMHNKNTLACTPENGAIVRFGRNCPVHYLAEFINEEELKKFQGLFPKPKDAVQEELWK